MSKEFTPNFNTPEELHSKEEVNKRNSDGMRGNLSEQLKNETEGDIAWEAEQLAKSYGIYLEFDRAKTGREKDWRYMIRVGIPGGGPLNKEQWAALDEIAEKYTVGPRSAPSIRLTTRQNVQYHWIKKADVIPLVSFAAKSGLLSINGCGDNVRNIMACPLSRYSTVFDGVSWAQKTAKYFMLPTAPFLQIFEIDSSYLRTEENEQRFNYGKQLLNRKFKIGFSSLIRDPKSGKLINENCVELRTNDMGIAPVTDGDKLTGFQIFIGGGQGERNGKPSIATLGQPVCHCSEDQLLKIMDAVVAIHRDWGDRENRHWARLKYLVKVKGIAWYRDRLNEYLGFMPDAPLENFDEGPRMMHHGWTQQETNSKWAYGLYVENGRLDNGGPNGDLRDLVKVLIDKFESEAIITPNQDLVFTNIDESAKTDFENVINRYKVNIRNGKPISKLRSLSGACVGRDTCRLTYTDSEKFEPELLDQLEARGFGDVASSIGITGCERQCFRPSTKTIGLVGTGLDRYQLRLMGTEDGRNQGAPLYSEDRTQMFMRSIPREQVADVIQALIELHKSQGKDNEEMGYTIRRIGEQGIINYLSEHALTKEIMAVPYKTKAVLE